MSDSLIPHGLQHTRLPCPSPTPGAYSNSRPSRQWCHPTISSSVVLFSSCLQSFPVSGPFAMSWFFTSGGQHIGVSASASVLPMNIQDWFSLGLTGCISLQSKGLSRVFSNPEFKSINCLVLSLLTMCRYWVLYCNLRMISFSFHNIRNRLDATLTLNVMVIVENRKILKNKEEKFISNPAI